MTTEQLKNIFGRFENLNLLFLIEDLRRGLVAKDCWQDFVENKLCPIAHGWRGECRREKVGYLRLSVPAEPWENAGLDRKTSSAFTTSWDDNDIASDELLSALESIYSERLADADAVQSVVSPDLTPAATQRLGFVAAAMEGRLAK